MHHSLNATTAKQSNNNKTAWAIIVRAPAVLSSNLNAVSNTKYVYFHIRFRFQFEFLI